MQNPAHDIKEAVTLFCASVSPDIQKAAFQKFWVDDAEFKHPLVHVEPGPNSRDQVLGVYQWYRAMSPKLDISVNDVIHDRPSGILLVDAVQTFHIRFSPFKPAPARLLVRITLRQESGLHYIEKQEDFYHPEDFMSLLIPPLVPVVNLALKFGALSSNLSARAAALIGLWSPTGGKKAA